MNRIEKILEHPLFLDCLEKNHTAEADRRFCRHNMEHFLDVARIGWILILEEQLAIEKVQIYAAGLLHDIGRFKQYEDGTPHEAAGAELAAVILKDCDFSEEEQKEILTAISGHRKKDKNDLKTLSDVLYRADKLSRPCFHCEAENECNWNQEKRNQTVKY